MVDSIGSVPFAPSDRRIAPVDAVATVAAPTTSADHTARAEAPEQLVSVNRVSAGDAPIDLERVARIRRAIAEGRYPLNPETVADRLIALKLDWTSHDPS